MFQKWQRTQLHVWTLSSRTWLWQWRHHGHGARSPQKSRLCHLEACARNSGTHHHWTRKKCHHRFEQQCLCSFTSSTWNSFMGKTYLQHWSYGLFFCFGSISIDLFPPSPMDCNHYTFTPWFTLSLYSHCPHKKNNLQTDQSNNSRSYPRKSFFCLLPITLPSHLGKILRRTIRFTRFWSAPNFHEDVPFTSGFWAPPNNCNKKCIFISNLCHGIHSPLSYWFPSTSGDASYGYLKKRYCWHMQCCALIGYSAQRWSFLLTSTTSVCWHRRQMTPKITQFTAKHATADKKQILT